ncbi:MAG: hypothetical protein ACOX23_02150 [Peptococcia bacterium]
MLKAVSPGSCQVEGMVCRFRQHQVGLAGYLRYGCQVNFLALIYCFPLGLRRDGGERRIKQGGTAEDELSSLGDESFFVMISLLIG